ncbi:P-loop containing nucleoside triphosphate hydrolase protein [Pilobolus umbonatus]|nr:P-loop containing nucleoside triphosphate hydrolase protein [Pilobolus umbonatus]
MPAITPAQLAELQRNTQNIRNICILAHVDHGKTTLSDSLLASNGIISSKMAGKVRYLDSREDEQERGITMESSAISLYFKLVKLIGHEGDQDKYVTNEYLINLIDSPGHVDFSSEVSTASRLCDGGLILIDVVEGVCTQTISVLKQAWIDKVRPILIFNKMDRLICELKMTPQEAYVHLNKILEQVNAIMATFFTGDLMESEAKKIDDTVESDEKTDSNKIYDWSVEDRDDSDIYFDPAKGNVIFSSAVDGWAFRVQQFASIYYKKLGFKEDILQKCLWGEYYYDPKAKRVLQPKHLKGKSLKPMFVQFVLDNIWAVYDSVVIHPDIERAEKIVNALKIKVLPRYMRSRDSNVLLTAIMSQWLPLSTCILLGIVGQLPPPEKAQRLRIPKILYPDIHRKDGDPLEPTNEVEEALYNCDTSPDAPVVAYVSKMFAVPVKLLPENRKKQITAEEMRENGRKMRELRALKDSHAYEGIPLNQEQLDLISEDAKAAVEEEEELKGESIIGFSRLYSGTIRVGQKLYVLGPKYDPSEPTKHVSEITVKRLYLIMGRELELLDEVSAGNVFGIGGLEGHILKNGTLASTLKNVRNMAGIVMESAPIVRVALEPANPTEMDKLTEGLKLLNQADPCVEVLLQESGEHVILTAGELHLERCLRDLKERFAKIEIHASKPIVPFRESIVRADLPTNKEKDGVVLPRGRIELKINSKLVTLHVQTIPLPDNVTKFLLDHSASIKAIVEKKIAGKNKSRQSIGEDVIKKSDDIISMGNTQLIPSDRLRDMLKEEFEIAKKEGGYFGQFYDNIVEHIWAFGPRRIGSNLLINRIPGYTLKPFFDVDSSKSDISADDKEEGNQEDPHTLSITNIAFNIQTGFQLSTLAGPLCAEPMTGVCYIVQDVQIHNEELMNTEGESTDVRTKMHMIQGQVIAAMKEACRQGFLDWSPRLFLAMYSCDIQASAEVLGRVYGVISKRKGKIVSEDLKDGTSFWQINAYLPVIESFGFSDEIRKRTSGAASPQLVFSGFEMLNEDPFWVPTTEEELEDLGEKADKENLAKKYMDTVRKRKGMFVEKKLIEHAEKQRTLKKN